MLPKSINIHDFVKRDQKHPDPRQCKTLPKNIHTRDCIKSTKQYPDQRLRDTFPKSIYIHNNIKCHQNNSYLNFPPHFTPLPFLSLQLSPPESLSRQICPPASLSWPPADPWTHASCLPRCRPRGISDMFVSWENIFIWKQSRCACWYLTWTRHLN